MPRGRTANPELREAQAWREDADIELRGGNALFLVEVMIQCRLGETPAGSKEEALLQQISPEDIQTVMDVFAVRRQAAGLATFDGLIGAYRHIQALEFVKRHNPDEWLELEEQLEWAKTYFTQKFPAQYWEWGNGKLRMMVEIEWLLDRVLDFAQQVQTGPSTDEHQKLTV
jgi:hypothetical protein